VFFPDIPGCASAGNSLFEAMENGEEALAAHIELLVQEGEGIPDASSEVVVDDDIEVASYFLAHVELPGKTVRLNITMDEGLVARIDRVARNRSAFLAEAARERLRELSEA
jgi:predicted RNase H-like HicB family nuclease